MDVIVSGFPMFVCMCYCVCGCYKRLWSCVRMHVIVSVFPMNVYVHVLVCSCVHAWYEVYVGDVCALLCVFSCVCVHQRSCDRKSRSSFPS